MKKLDYCIDIHAPKEKVWNFLWDDVTYRAWTKVFHEGSYAVSDWNEGSPIHFLTPDGRGMYSTIGKLIPNTFMSFVHHGELIDFKEVPPNEKTESWAGGTENYTLAESNGVTTLTVSHDTVPEFEAYLQAKFPLAMAEIKRLCESEAG
ncbi:MAG: SRPBCC domain-containing protein [Bacteroidetes bacterium]|nr:SRPBCC domain-containing protein [Bacteroidota bacterium]